MDYLVSKNNDFIQAGSSRKRNVPAAATAAAAAAAAAATATAAAAGQRRTISAEYVEGANSSEMHLSGRLEAFFSERRRGGVSRGHALAVSRFRELRTRHCQVIRKNIVIRTKSAW